ncbi:MAG: response regulator transcription factor, partial [Acidimicrobiia bacterium]|nr:response regulator transcription factor [Acidimicrobiia bacterium]MDX2465687.1 response regulator transcription factor [Acidimicrobiia bacterium]
RLVRDYLHQAGFDVLQAGDGPTALHLARAEKPDMIVLDLGLPGMDGYDVTRELRARSSVPIIMLTARSEESDRIVGLELGADDYIVKPFSPRELVARIRAVLRRADATLGGGEMVRAGSVTIDIPKMRVAVDGSEVELTSSEFDILLTLARQPGRIYTRAQLLDIVHGVSFESYERSVDAHIKNIRRKIEPDPKHPALVLTVYGVGYKFADA